MIAKSPVPIRKSLMPVGRSRPATKRSGLLGVTIHNTGNYSIGANAEMHRRYQHGSGADNYTSYHYVVDDKEIIQLIPEDEISWHAGDGATGKGNTQTISIEICVNRDGDIRKATDNAVWLTADILWRNKIPHGRIYQHYDWNKKNCPMEIRRGNPYTFEVFVDKVNDYLFPKPTKNNKLYKVQIGAYSVKANADKALKEAIAKGYKDAFIVETGSVETPSEPIKPVIREGVMVSVRKGAKSYEGKSIASWVFNQKYRVDELKGDRAVLDKQGIHTAFNIKDLVL